MCKQTVMLSTASASHDEFQKYVAILYVFRILTGMLIDMLKLQNGY